MVKKKETNVNKKVERRKIPTKNYIIVGVIFALSIFLVFFLRDWYKSYQEYEKTIPVLTNVLSEVRYNEIYNYIGDNQSVIIYMGVADDEDCREVESKFKKVIEERHLKNKIVYFNITDVEDKELLLKEFNDKYATKDRISAYPAIILFEDGKIVDFKSKTANKNLLVSDIEQLLDEYEIEGEY